MPKPLSLLFLLLVPTATLAAPNDATPDTPRATRSTKSYSLRSARQIGDVDRVTAVLEVGGDVKTTEQNEIARAKMSVAANLAYDERTLETPTSTGGCRRSVRYYDRADAVIKVDDGGTKPRLRDDRRLIVAKIDEPEATFFSPQGPLTREELDLIEIHADSLLLDGFLPERQVAQGESWDHPKSLIAAMLGLEEIKTNDVASKLAEISDATAMIEMAGSVEGAVGGVTTRIELKGKYRFDRKTGRIDWFGLAVREDRDIGHVNQGLDIVARLKMQIEPQNASASLSDKAIQGLALEPTESDTKLMCESVNGVWRISHDRRWFDFSNEHDLAVLRLIDRGEMVAQCNVAPLARVEPGKQATLEQFQADIQEALGKQFGQFMAASQRANEKQYRILRVVVQGVVSELPIQWHYYLIANEQGQQVVFTFTVEESLASRLGELDNDLINSFDFVDPQVAATDAKTR